MDRGPRYGVEQWHARGPLTMQPPYRDFLICNRVFPTSHRKAVVPVVFASEISGITIKWFSVPLFSPAYQQGPGNRGLRNCGWCSDTSKYPESRTSPKKYGERRGSPALSSLA